MALCGELAVLVLVAGAASERSGEGGVVASEAGGFSVEDRCTLMSLVLLTADMADTDD